jgi:hypothetical protein
MLPTQPGISESVSVYLFCSFLMSLGSGTCLALVLIKPSMELDHEEVAPVSI